MSRILQLKSRWSSCRARLEYAGLRMNLSFFSDNVFVSLRMSCEWNRSALKRGGSFSSGGNKSTVSAFLVFTGKKTKEKHRCIFVPWTKQGDQTQGLVVSRIYVKKKKKKGGWGGEYVRLILRSPKSSDLFHELFLIHPSHFKAIHHLGKSNINSQKIIKLPPPL